MYTSTLDPIPAVNNRCSMKNSLIRKKMRVSSAVASLTWLFPLFFHTPLPHCVCLFARLFFIGTRTCHFLRKSLGEPMELEPITSSRMKERERERQRHSGREERQDDTAALSVREDLNQLYCGHHYFYYYDHLHFAAPTHTYTHRENKHMNFGSSPCPPPPFCLSLSPVVCLCFFSGRECKCAPRTRVCVACFLAA